MENMTHPITDLREVLGESRAEEIVPRLVRLPALWQALHVESLRQQLLVSKDFSLAYLAKSIGELKAEDDSAAALKRLIGRAGSMVEAWQDKSPLQIASKAESDFESTLTFAQAMADGNDLLRDCLASEDPGMRHTALQAAYTNTLLGDYSWPELTPSELERILLDALHSGAALDLSALLDANSGNAAEDHALAGKGKALLHWLQGDLDRALREMEIAWEESTEQAASIAEAIGRLAAIEDQSLIEVEARARALNLRPSPTRRASLAISHLTANEPQTAFQVLEQEPAHPIERIALGLTYLTMGQPKEAAHSFRQVEPADIPHDIDWQLRLIRGWIRLEEMTEASDALTASVAWHPDHIELRQLGADLAMRTGDYQAAVDHASLLSCLAPNDSAAAELLAEAYQANGQPARSLEIWTGLVDEIPTAKQKAVEAALAADEVSTALAFSQELVEAEPQAAGARLALGKSLIKAGNQQGGQVHIRRATELEPNDPEPWLVLAELQADQGEDEASGWTLSQAIQACPESPEIMSARSRWLETQGRPTEALELCQQACKLDGDDLSLQIQHASLLQKLDRIEEAGPLFQEILRKQPANWQARIKLAAIRLDRNQADEALDLLEGLPDDAGSLAHRLFAQALLQSEAGDDEQADRGQLALAAISRALDEDKQDPELEYWRARALQMSERHDEALQGFQQAMKALPENARKLKQECLFGQAEAALASDQVPVAISLLERGRQQGQLAPTGLALLSKAYLAAGLADEAFEPAMEACQQAPQEETIRQQFLATAKASGELAMALDQLETWVDDSPDSIPLLYEKANIHSQLGQRQEARGALAQIAWNKRRDAETLQRVGADLLEMDEVGSALRVLQHADYQDPGDHARQKILAEAAAKAGRHDIAGSAWEKILQSDPSDLNALLGAAEAYWQRDQRMTAIGYWQRALNVDPQRADLHAKLARAQLENGETVQALEHFRSAAKLSPSNDRLRLEAARAFMANHSYNEALELLQDAEPAEDLERIGLMAQLYLGLGRPQEALATIHRYSGDEPNARLSSLTALALSRTGSVDQAIAELAKAIDSDPANADEASWVARAAIELGQWETASDTLSGSWTDSADASKLLALELTVNSRLADAHTLMAKLGNASRHAPSDSCVSRDAFKQLHEKLQSAADIGWTPAEISAWQARLAYAFRQSQATDPNDVAALPSNHMIRQQAVEGLALTQVVTGQPEAALRTLADAPDKLQAGPWAPLIAGCAHLQTDRSGMARKAFGAVEKQDPLWPMAAYLVGRCWQQEGRTDEAINSWNAAVLAWPSEPTWQQQLASAYREEHRPEAALPHYQAALEGNPDSSELHLPLARTHFELGHLTEAVEHYRQASKHADKDASLLSEVGRALMAVGEPKEAYEQFQAALELSPQDVASEVGAAQAALRIGEQRQSEKHTAKALRRNPREPELVVALVDILLESGNEQRALALLDDAYGQSKPPIVIARAKARVLFELGNAQEAIGLLRRVLEEDPDDDASWSALAEAYAGADQIGQAIDALRLALNIRPGYKPYRIKLARLFRESGQLDQALDELAALQNEYPKDPQIPFEMGRVHQARRQLRQALAAFQRTIQLKADSASAYFQAGLVLKGLKAYPQAVEMLEQAVSINPNDSEAMHQLAAVQALQLVHGGIQATAVS